MTCAAFLTTTASALRQTAHQSTITGLKVFPVDSSSHVEASAATTSLVNSLATAAATSSTTKEFEPILPDTSALLGIGAVVLASAAATWVWANQVVPTSRTKLALSKRQGDVKEYLEELEDASGERQFEEWLFTDWLEQRNNATGSQKKEPALPILKKAKWNSGDNPVLAATALILLGITLTAFTERVSSMLS
ncbi:expressed unknown protein [Seminavis robusta]|uniref:Uncharacterized protein n=1 Tax=Seminavis robusta TaxID=568900 RepID=A0A9N8HER3_9STRA|nr:expressed unknown protein [Seminavis robusta]|eukprot:Sro486_g152650.1 n/a (193) ;mRNA; r:36116-36694